MKKNIRIEYDPYNNHIEFRISLDEGKSWQELSETSELLKYQNQECVFSNCVEDIVSVINQYQNSSLDGLCIQFIGTDDDFEILKDIVAKENDKNSKKGKIQTRRIGSYKSANDAIRIIRNSYSRIASEFEDYLPGKERFNEDDDCAKIGNLISIFTGTVSKEIPVCVIGTYSVGKSAFINAIIGDEILPSKVDPCTARDVRVECGTNVSISLEYKGEYITLYVKKGSLVLEDNNSDLAEEFYSVIFL